MNSGGVRACLKIWKILEHQVTIIGKQVSCSLQTICGPTFPSHSYVHALRRAALIRVI